MVRRRLRSALALVALIALFARSSAVAEMPQGDPPKLVSAAASDDRIIWHDDFDRGWRAAKQSGRPMVIYITSQQCRYCDAMKRDTWCDRSISKRLKDKFVAIRLSPDRNASVLSRIRVPAYPMTLIGDPKGKILAHRVGYQPPAEMHRLLKTYDRPLK